MGTTCPTTANRSMAMNDLIEKAKAWVNANQDKAELAIAFIIGVALGGFIF